VHDHRALGEREGEEHTDREQRNQRFGMATERRVDHGRWDGQHENAVAEGETVSQTQEKPRDVAVAGHEVQKAWKAVER